MPHTLTPSTNSISVLVCLLCDVMICLLLFVVASSIFKSVSLTLHPGWGNISEVAVFITIDSEAVQRYVVVWLTSKFDLIQENV